MTCELDQILNQQVIQSIVTRPEMSASIFRKKMWKQSVTLCIMPRQYLTTQVRDIAHATYR